MDSEPPPSEITGLMVPVAVRTTQALSQGCRSPLQSTSNLQLTPQDADPPLILPQEHRHKLRTRVVPKLGKAMLSSFLVLFNPPGCFDQAHMTLTASASCSQTSRQAYGGLPPGRWPVHAMRICHILCAGTADTCLGHGGSMQNADDRYNGHMGKRRLHAATSRDGAPTPVKCKFEHGRSHSPQPVLAFTHVTHFCFKALQQRPAGQ